MENQIMNIDEYSFGENVISEFEAKELTEAIRSTTSALYILLKKAHDGKAWISLGYDTWADYVHEEFSISRQRSYQLINQATVIEQLTESAGTEIFITDKEARTIKKNLPEITEKIEKEKTEGLLSEDEIRERARAIISQTKSEHDYEDENHNTDYKPTVHPQRDIEDDEVEVYEEEPEQENYSRTSSQNVRNYSTATHCSLLKKAFSIFEELPTPSDVVSQIDEEELDYIKLDAKKALIWINNLIENI